MKENDEVLDETQFNTTSTPIIATNRIEKPYITKGFKKELSNFGGTSLEYMGAIQDAQ